MRIDPNVPSVLINFGLLQIDEGDTAHGIALCERGVALDGSLRSWLGVTYARAGEFDRAVAAYSTLRDREDRQFVVNELVHASLQAYEHGDFGTSSPKHRWRRCALIP